MVYHHLPIHPQPRSADTPQMELIVAAFGWGERARQAQGEMGGVYQWVNRAKPSQLCFLDDAAVSGVACEVEVVEIVERETLLAVHGRQPIEIGQWGQAVNWRTNLVSHGHILAHALANPRQGRNDVMRVDLRTAAAHDLRPLGVFANHGNGLRLVGVQGEQIPLVFEQDNRFGRHLAGQLAVGAGGEGIIGRHPLHKA